MLTAWLEAQLILLFARLGPPGRRAQSMVEYAIIAALIAVVAIAAVTTLGKDIAGAFNNIANSVGGLGQASP